MSRIDKDRRVFGQYLETAGDLQVGKPCADGFRGEQGKGTGHGQYGCDSERAIGDLTVKRVVYHDPGDRRKGDRNGQVVIPEPAALFGDVLGLEIPAYPVERGVHAVRPLL